MFWVKAGAVVAVISAVLGIWHLDRQAQYTAGETAAKLKCAESTREALESRINEKLEKLGVAIANSEKEARIAREKATELSTTLGSIEVTLDDIEEWKKLDTESECTRLGDEFFRLFNEPAREFRNLTE